jgi:predicted small lipoprotein YifL
MGIDQKILVRARGLAVLVASVSALMACGQKGALYLPNDPDFKERATLPDIVRRQIPGASPAVKPASTAASATATPSATPASAATGR